MRDAHLDLNRPDSPRAFTSSGPMTPRRTSDVRERREWERQQLVANTPSAISQHYEKVEQERKAQEAQWQAEAQQRREDIEQRRQQTIEHNARVLREREAAQKTKAEHATLALVKGSMYEKLGASDEEIARVERLVARNHAHANDDVALREVLLLKLRAVLE